MAIASFWQAIMSIGSFWDVDNRIQEETALNALSSVHAPFKVMSFHVLGLGLLHPARSEPRNRTGGRTLDVNGSAALGQ